LFTRTAHKDAKTDNQHMAKEAEVFATNRCGLSTAPHIGKSARTKQVRVLIADDHPVMRKGVINRLGGRSI